MNQRLLIRFLLGLSLLTGGRPSCQTSGDSSPKPVPPPIPSAINPCEPEAQECKDQIMARERLKELALRSQLFEERIVIQKLKKIGKNLYAPGAANFYRGEVTFGKKTRFRKIFEKVNWRSSFWHFYLPGFAEMCFLDPDYFDSLNYDLEFSGDETLLGRRCRVYRVKPKKPTKVGASRGQFGFRRMILRLSALMARFNQCERLVGFFWWRITGFLLTRGAKKYQLAIGSRIIYVPERMLPKAISPIPLLARESHLTGREIIRARVPKLPVEWVYRSSLPKLLRENSAPEWRRRFEALTVLSTRQLSASRYLTTLAVRKPDSGMPAAQRSHASVTWSR